jgi:SAM-dependent methyltransferase
MEPATTFDTAARRVRRYKIASAPPEDRWLLTRMAQELRERWEDAEKITGPILIIGNDVGVISKELPVQPIYADSRAADVSPNPSVVCDEAYLPFADQSFSAVFSVGMIDTVNDVPGSLILARRALKPGGLFLGAFLGAGSAQTLRSFVHEFTHDGTPRVRMHPQIDVRAAGDLLARAGFSGSVADMETISARYSSLARLIEDVRANSGGNALASRGPLSRSTLADWQTRFKSERQDDGRVTEIFCPVYLTGRSPVR